MLRTLSLLLLLAFAPSAYGQEDDAPEAGWSPQVYLSSFYSPQGGLGVGLGVQRNGLPGMPWGFARVTAAPQQHEGLYSVTLATRDYDETRWPEAPRHYALVRAAYAIDQREYHGIGPSSPADAEVLVELQRFRSRLRVGLDVVPGFSVQLLGGADAWEARRYREDEPGAFDLLTDEGVADLAYVVPSLPTTRERPPTWFGVGGAIAALDYRDGLDYTRKGWLLEGRVLQHAPLSKGADVRLRSYEARLFGYVPLGRLPVLSLRALFGTVQNLGEAPVPFYFLPDPGQLVTGISEGQLFAPTMLAVGAEIRRPVLHLLRSRFGVELVGAAHLLGTYDDFPSDFGWRLGWDETYSPTRDSYPMRPIFALGFRVYEPGDDETMFTGAVRLTAEGISLGSLSFFHDLRAPRR